MPISRRQQITAMYANADSLDITRLLTRPLVRAIIESLARKRVCVSRLATTLGWPMSQTSEALATLTAAQLLCVEHRKRMRIYGLSEHLHVEIGDRNVQISAHCPNGDRLIILTARTPRAGQSRPHAPTAIDPKVLHHGRFQSSGWKDRMTRQPGAVPESA